MNEDLRKSGIDILGDVPWGTHLCQFYDTKEDLLEILIPFFKAGLENHEFCLWITADPLPPKEALHALEQSIPNFSQYLQNQSIEILPYHDWYMKFGKFDGEGIQQAWLERLDQALERGFEGMRVNGNETWLKKENWENFMQYEKELNKALQGKPIIVLCTYPLTTSAAGALLDVALAHEYVISRRKGLWEILEEPEIKKIKADLIRINHELDIRVTERTSQLDKVIRELKHEIEQRKIAEERIRLSELQLAKAQRLAHIGNWNWNFQRGTVSWSDELYRIFGLPPQQNEIGLWAMDMINPDDRNKVMDTIEQSLKTKEPFSIYYCLVRPDGQQRIVHSRGEVITDGEGRPLTVLGTTQDVTEQKRSEDELKLAYQRLSYHVDNTPLAVIEWDKDLAITRWSGQAEKIFGWKASEVAGKNLYDPDFLLVHRGDQGKVHEIAYELTHGLINRNLSLNRNYRKDGKVIYCEWYNSVLRDEKGNVVTILSLAHDVTQRKQAEDQLTQSYEQIKSLSGYLQKIREEERTRISHEIHDELGQQLTVMKMDASWLGKKLETADDSVKQKIKDLLELLDGAVQSVRKISSELRPTILDDLGLVAAMEWHLNEFKKRSGIEFVFREPKQELSLNESIKTGMYRIFQESLTNVARHAEAKKIWVSLEVNKGQLELTIEDDGKGFDGGTVNETKTLGILGMKERAIMMGGLFQISSLPGKGTNITVNIPWKGKRGNQL